MKIKELITELQALDPELEAITVINAMGLRATVECVDKGYFDGENFVSEIEDPDNIPNAVDLVWNPL